MRNAEIVPFRDEWRKRVPEAQECACARKRRAIGLHRALRRARARAILSTRTRQNRSREGSVKTASAKRLPSA